MKNLFQNTIGLKFIIIGVLTVMLLIPIAMISDLIRDRQGTQIDVEREIAQRSSKAQTVVGPFIHVQYHEYVLIDGKETKKDREQFILPETLFVNSKLNSFEKYRGIYKAQLYQSTNELTGQIDFSALGDIAVEAIDAVNLVLAISDVRGIGIGTSLVLNGEKQTLTPGTGLEYRAHGLRVELDYTAFDHDQSLPFRINFDLRGMKKLNIVPVGKETRIDMSADWPHPSFIGDFLPAESDINDQGFKAHWTTNSFATSMGDVFSSCIQYNACDDENLNSVGVNLIDPVNHYLKNHRAVSYAILIILLVFSCFFLLEVLRAKPIHPIQYGFVGLALAVFYLLLISLSEHIGFTWAYICSAVASIGLLSIYVTGMLHDSKQGAICFGSLSVLYAMLYSMLSAEDYALLMGSLLCFMVLSMLMMLTRKIDWYSKNDKQSTSTSEPLLADAK